MRNIQIPGRSNILSNKGIAATSHPLSTLEAISILKKGGNAIDAAIAASAVQSVVEPGSTGVGGDCFALISINGKNVVSFNGSGIAPKKASLEFFKKKNIDKIELTSPHSVTVPGAVHAWKTMHESYGKLEFEQLFFQAENYARYGFPIYEIVSESLKNNIEKLKKNEISRKIFLKNDYLYNFKEIHKNINLADTLKSIGKNGINDFYNGYIAQDIVDSLNELGGCHDIEDLNNQNTIVTNSIFHEYKNNLLHQCPPNGPGVTVLLMMAILDKFNFKNIKPLSFERLHIQAEVTKIVFEIKEKMLGDPKSMKIDIKSLISEENIKNLFEKISMDKCYMPKNFTITAHPETVYITVVDKDQNAVSFINSICFAYGSGITTKKTGILLQNRGVNFRLTPGHPNSINGNKRPLHTIIPGMITTKDLNPLLSFGVMGGQYQPVGQANLLQNIFDYEMNIQEAIDFPRAFCLNDKLYLEKTIPEDIFSKLKKIGHNLIYTSNPLGGAQAIFVDYKNGVFVGGSDSRKDGCALGI
ncbi:MAG: putative gamma-glutamyltransferase YwrD [Alphaproteobacteria bacterium MarineAlpha5_Bin9]|nr:MAG: putative gamma-glutamyltransferase YwrD [Alphaproteobacteria bacterium MarineAlpha5_Bin9]|tara:strand:+ start:1393 stop:2979 length:1587 start_codon:yes stop_codon:yes gene_type:complete